MKNISELVSRTLATGLPPLALSYRTVYGVRSGAPIAYRADLQLNSVELGSVYGSEFAAVADANDVGMRLGEWAISHALEAIRAFAAAGRSPRWISVHCPVTLLQQPDFYKKLKHLLEKAEYDPKGIALALEFSEELLTAEGEALSKAILDLKLLGVRSLLLCGDAGNLPFFRMTQYPVDAVLIPSAMTAMATDRNKPALFSELTQLLQTMGAEVYLMLPPTVQEPDGDTRSAYSRTGCEGYSSGTAKRMTLAEATCEKEEP